MLINYRRWAVHSTVVEGRECFGSRFFITVHGGFGPKRYTVVISVDVPRDNHCDLWSVQVATHVSVIRTRIFECVYERIRNLITFLDEVEANLFPFNYQCTRDNIIIHTFAGDGCSDCSNFERNSFCMYTAKGSMSSMIQRVRPRPNGILQL